jgi:hypothetical protein
VSLQNVLDGVDGTKLDHRSPSCAEQGEGCGTGGSEGVERTGSGRTGDR